MGTSKPRVTEFKAFRSRVGRERRELSRSRSLNSAKFKQGREACMCVCVFLPMARRSWPPRIGRVGRESVSVRKSDAPSLFCVHVVLRSAIVAFPYDPPFLVCVGCPPRVLPVSCADPFCFFQNASCCFFYCCLFFSQREHSFVTCVDCASNALRAAGRRILFKNVEPKLSVSWPSVDDPHGGL